MDMSAINGYVNFTLSPLLYLALLLVLRHKVGRTKLQFSWVADSNLPPPCTPLQHKSYAAESQLQANARKREKSLAAQTFFIAVMYWTTDIYFHQSSRLCVVCARRRTVAGRSTATRSPSATGSGWPRPP